MQTDQGLYLKNDIDLFLRKGTTGLSSRRRRELTGMNWQLISLSLSAKVYQLEHINKKPTLLYSLNQIITCKADIISILVFAEKNVYMKHRRQATGIIKPVILNYYY